MIGIVKDCVPRRRKDLNVELLLRCLMLANGYSIAFYVFTAQQSSHVFVRSCTFSSWNAVGSKVRLLKDENSKLDVGVRFWIS